MVSGCKHRVFFRARLGGNSSVIVFEEAGLEKVKKPLTASGGVAVNSAWLTFGSRCKRASLLLSFEALEDINHCSQGDQT